MASAYDPHRDLLALPSAVGAMIVGFALGSWWVGLGLLIASLYPYHRIYSRYFSESLRHPRRRDIPTNLLFMLGQAAFWIVALFVVLALRYAIAAI